MPRQHTFTFTLLAAVFLVVGDAILQIAAVGVLPSNSSQWYALVQPETVNGLTFIVVMTIAGMMASSSATLGGLTAASIISNGIHRWVAGASFTPMIFGVHVVLFFLLGWVGLWLAGAILSDRTSQ